MITRGYPYSQPPNACTLCSQLFATLYLVNTTVQSLVQVGRVLRTAVNKVYVTLCCPASQRQAIYDCSRVFSVNMNLMLNRNVNEWNYWLWQTPCHLLGSGGTT